ncbi:MAG: diguanylate cyclase [Solirubrobacteraceae bacterium]|nr:MAG: hypothetical protein DLM63_13005 [Solirubrobacterales bacterium]
MNFRARLTLFFVLLVLVPVGSLAVVLDRVLTTRQAGRDDARAAQGQIEALNLYDEASRAAQAALPRLTGDAALIAALRASDSARATAQARLLLARAGLSRIVATIGTRTIADVGDPGAIAPYLGQLTTTSGRALGTLDVAVARGGAFASRVEMLTALKVVIVRNGTPLFSAFPAAAAAKLPNQGAATIAGHHYRVSSLGLIGFPGETLRLSVFADQSASQTPLGSLGVLAAVLLVAFIVLALVFAVAISRSLQGQLDRFLAAARRLSSGDFSTPVPVEGRDEFAALGRAFNKMSLELEGRLDELEQERRRLRDTIRRTGEAFGASLDRDGLLAIGIQTAIDGVQAQCGRALVRSSLDSELREVAVAGELPAAGDALAAVEAQAERTLEVAELDTGGLSALAYPLAPRGDRGELALISVARAGEPFSRPQRDLFSYLGQQTARSMVNVSLHEFTRLQATTDDLTGLANYRRFHDLLKNEVERARRFNQSLGLVLLDIDDFKQINDTYGHQQGDVVLRELGRLLRASAREIDEPARYGGEELVVALPQTDLEGAYHLAERLRKAICALEVELLNGGGKLRLTASCGAAAIPDSARSADDLIAAADAALYRAKRAGKNRSERAHAAGTAGASTD